MIDRGDDFAHCVLGDAGGKAIKHGLLDVRQTHGALARVMRHRVADKGELKFFSYLLHDGSLADAWSAFHVDGPLALDGNNGTAVLILRTVRLHCIFNGLPGFSNIHVSILLFGLFMIVSDLCCHHT